MEGENCAEFQNLLKDLNDVHGACQRTAAYDLSLPERSPLRSACAEKKALALLGNLL
jgi:hypothetical protein